MCSGYVFWQFNSLAKEKRETSTSDLPFEYCYVLRSFLHLQALVVLPFPL